MAQNDRGEILEPRRVGRRRLRHPQPGGDAVAARARARPKARSSRSSTRPTPQAARDMAPALYAVRDSQWAAWMTIQTGCDNSCAYCIVPGGARGRDQPTASRTSSTEATMLAARGVTEITVLGQNVNSYGRDLTRRRPLFARAAARPGRGRRHRAHPLHEPAPQGPARRDDRRDGRDARGLSAAAPAAAVGLEPRARPRCAADTAPSATWSAWPGARGASRTSP